MKKGKSGITISTALFVLGSLFVVGYIKLFGNYCLGATVPFLNTCLGIQITLDFWFGIILIVAGTIFFFAERRHAVSQSGTFILLLVLVSMILLVSATTGQSVLGVYSPPPANPYATVGVLSLLSLVAYFVLKKRRK